MTESQPSPFGTEYSPSLVRLLLLMSPVMFALCYALSWLQSAEPWVCLLISAVGFVGVLCASGLYRLRGSAAAGDARWIAVLLAVIAAFASR